MRNLAIMASNTTIYVIVAYFLRPPPSPTLYIHSAQPYSAVQQVRYIIRRVSLCKMQTSAICA